MYCMNYVSQFFTPEYIVRVYAHTVTDFVLINPNKLSFVEIKSPSFKFTCSSFIEKTFHSFVSLTFVNGNLVYNDGIFDESHKGM